MDFALHRDELAKSTPKVLGGLKFKKRIQVICHLFVSLVTLSHFTTSPLTSAWPSWVEAGGFEAGHGGAMAALLGDGDHACGGCRPRELRGEFNEEWQPPCANGSAVSVFQWSHPDDIMAPGSHMSQSSAVFSGAISLTLKHSLHSPCTMSAVTVWVLISMLVPAC